MPGVAFSRTWEKSSAPWVTSGSSPASLIVPASAPSSVRRQNSRRICTRLPLGKTISTASAAAPLSSRRAAARLVAVAQLPVVRPLRSGAGCSAVSSRIEGFRYIKQGNRQRLAPGVEYAQRLRLGDMDAGQLAAVAFAPGHQGHFALQGDGVGNQPDRKST